MRRSGVAPHALPVPVPQLAQTKNGKLPEVKDTGVRINAAEDRRAVQDASPQQRQKRAAVGRLLAASAKTLVCGLTVSDLSTVGELRPLSSRDCPHPTRKCGLCADFRRELSSSSHERWLERKGN